jgi:HPt (histidine-containing phosphotransfer) domain-containing protein
MDDYISKPIQLSQLRAVLQKWGGELLSKSRPDGDAPVVLDRAVLDSLRQLDEIGDGSVRDLVRLYLDQVPPGLEVVAQALLHQDPAAFGAAMHRLKGSSSSIGAQRIASVCRELEASARDGHLPDAKATLESLHSEIESFRAAAHELGLC